MDLIALCAMTVTMHLLINRCLGHLSGWLRVIHWPAMLSVALCAHVLAVVGPLAWLIGIAALWMGRASGVCDEVISLAGAAFGAWMVRRAAARRR